VPSTIEDDATTGARRLAFRVVLIEYGALALTLLTLVISAFAYTGHMILASQQQILAGYQSLGRERVALIKEITGAAALFAADPLTPPPGCDRAYRPAGQTAPPSDTFVHPASQVTTGAMADGAAAYAAYPPLCAIYWKYKQASQDIAGATLHLSSWISVGLYLPYVRDVFGVDPVFIRTAATRHDEYCARLGFQNEPDGHCADALVEVVYHTGEVAASLLACIAHYVLPALYGCLGAAAATLRALRRKVELTLVAMTDRGRVFQDIILGLLCGAVVGLFAGEFGKDSSTDGLGLWALALLAGYNVSGMLAFLDDLSNRVFRPVHAQSTDP
jgi:hypothetical protein